MSDLGAIAVRSIDRTVTGRMVSGVITDAAGVPASRMVTLLPRFAVYVSDVRWSGVDGYYVVRARLDDAGREHVRLVHAGDDPGPTDPVLPDLIDRVIPG